MYTLFTFIHDSCLCIFRKFSNMRRYQLLRSHSQAADRLLDDTDDDDPLLEPNPDLSVDRRLALSDDNSDDPLGNLVMTLTPLCFDQLHQILFL